MTAAQSVQIGGAVLAVGVLLGTIGARLAPAGAWRRGLEDTGIILGCAAPAVALVARFLQHVLIGHETHRRRHGPHLVLADAAVARTFIGDEPSLVSHVTRKIHLDDGRVIELGKNPSLGHVSVQVQMPARVENLYGNRPL